MSVKHQLMDPSTTAEERKMYAFMRSQMYYAGKELLKCNSDYNFHEMREALHYLSPDEPYLKEYYQACELYIKMCHDEEAKDSVAEINAKEYISRYKLREPFVEKIKKLFK